MNNSVKFTKMHGLGNDFVVIDATKNPFTLSPQNIAKLGNRFTGIGFDQMLVILASDEPGIDFCYQIYNQDGSEVGNCGNGVRCFGRYVLERGLTNKRHLHVKTKTARMSLKVDDENQITVDMGSPDFNLSSLPCLLDDACNPAHTYTISNCPYSFGLVSMGNPHAVILVDELNALNIGPIAQLLQNSPLFPQSVNVGFMQIIDQNNVNLRVYERGVGETKACGTGACAAIASGIAQGLLAQHVNVNLTGGLLNISWEKEQALFMKGPAAFVFDGEINISHL